MVYTTYLKIWIGRTELLTVPIESSPQIDELPSNFDLSREESRVLQMQLTITHLLQKKAKIFPNLSIINEYKSIFCT